MGSVPNILKGAKKALDKANNFTKSVTSNKPSMFTPNSEAPTDYSHAREARKAPEFMGVRSNEAPEINTALASREQAKKALDQQ